MPTRPLRLAVLLSGAGSTMANLHDHILRGELPAEIAVVVSSRERVLGLQRASERGIPTAALTRKPYRPADFSFDVDGYSAALAALLEPFRPDLIALAGFMTRLGAPLLDRFEIVNVHPALLPAFGGAGFFGHHVHESVLAAEVQESGATVHYVDAEYDHGPIILQETVPVLAGDTPDTLAARVQAAERRIYPRAIALIAEGRVVREGRLARILPPAAV